MNRSSTRFILGSLIITLLAVAGILLLASAPNPIRPGEEFHLLILLHEPDGALVSMAVLLLALVPAVRRAGTRLVGWVAAHPLQTSFLFLVVSAAGALFVYRDHPLSQDEYAPRYQSLIFAAGRLTTQLPVDLLDWLIPRPLQGTFLATDPTTGRVASSYWPGHALVLAPFSALGIPWLLNPIFGALTVWLVYRLAHQLTGDRWLAGLAAALTAASPAVLIMAISYYAMPGHLALNLGFTLLLLRPSAKRLLAAGAVGSLALVFHNPVPHTLYALPWIVWLAARQESRRLLPFLLIGYMPLALLLGVGWFALLAKIQTATILESAGVPPSRGSIALLWESWIEPIFSWPTWSVVRTNLLALVKLWLWAVPGLPLLAVLGLRRRLPHPAIVVLGWSAALTLLGYLLFPFDQGLGWGDRYFHPAWATLPLLAVTGLAMARIADRAPGTVVGSQLRGYVGALVLGSLVFGHPLRLVQVSEFVGSQLARVPKVTAGTPHVVLLYREAGYHVYDLIQHDPLLRTRPLLLESLGADRDTAMLRRRFPGIERLAKTSHGEVWGIR